MTLLGTGTGIRAATGTPAAPASLPLEPADSSARYGLLATLACVCLVRIAIIAVGIASTATAAPEDFGQFALGRPWMAFDSEWYLLILREGYPEGGIPPCIAFFPLLPLMGRMLTPWLEAGTALLVIANLCALIGFGFFHEWCRALIGARAAFWSCLALATFPAAASFSAALTEAPFMMGVAITLFLMQRQRPLAAATVCGLATGLRPTGIALAITVWLWCWLRIVIAAHPHWLEPRTLLSRRRRMRLALLEAAGATFRAPALARLALVGALSVSGMAVYQGYLWHRYGRADAYLQAQSYWQPGGLRTDEQRAAEAEQAQRAAAEVRDLPFYLAKAATPQAWNRGFMLVVVGLAAWGLLRPSPIPRLLFVLPLVIFLVAYVPGWGARASSVARFLTAALPCFALMTWIFLARRRTAALAAVVMAQFGVQAYYAWLFSRGTWIG